MNEAPNPNGSDTRIARDGRLFEALFEQALDSVLIADDNRRYVDVNPAACELIGRPREEIIGHDIAEFFEMDEEAVPSAWNSFVSEGAQVGICRVQRPDGSVRYASFQARANFVPGLHLSILRDVTEKRDARQALAAKNRELESANSELARSNAELSHFAYAVGHDLREPLRTVASFAGLLARRMQCGDDEVKEYVGYISDAVERMNAFLIDLLAYAQAAQHKNSLREIDSEMVLEWALMNLRSAIEETGAQVTYDPLPAIHADQAQMAQVFQNLLGNALKYHSEATPRIHLSARPEGGEWIFSVEDNGIGIPAEQHERIFGIFKRLHGRDVPGTGLGLAMCKRIVENHGGRIWVESEVGKGSKFFFTVPA